MNTLIVDALASGKGERKTTKDALGAGPRAIAGILISKGINVRVVESERISKNFPFSEYDCLLLSGMSMDLPSIREIITNWHNGPVLIGGPVTAEPEKALLKSGADIAVIGEGEKTLEELIYAGLKSGIIPPLEDLRKIRGIAYFHGKNVEFNALRPVLHRSEYNKYAPSTQVITYYHLYKSARVYVEVLRGCSNYHRANLESDCIECNRCRGGSYIERYDCPKGIPPGCGYCGVPSLYGPPKSRSIKNIIDEVINLIALGVTRIVLSAPCFLDYGRDLLVEPDPLTDPRSPEPNYKELDTLLSSLTAINAIANGNASVMIENIKPSLVTKRAADLLGNYLKGTPVSVGFETGCPQHSFKLGRPSSPDENILAIRRLHNAGLKPYVYFIHGLPGQDRRTVAETVNAIKKSVDEGAKRIILYRFMSLPMSTFSNRPSAPPNVKDPLSRQIFEAAKKANQSVKEELIGTKIRVVVAERYDKNSHYTISYPLLHGPVVLLDAENLSEGNVINATITKIASDRMVYGHI